MSYLFPTYARWEIEPDFAMGSYLTDKNGKTYLDFTAGIGVCNIGHQHPTVKDAVQRQLNRYWHVSNLFTMSEQEVAAERLAKAAGLDAVFFANSGAEANEGAIKLARKATGRTKIITFEKSFHGRTFATMAATGQDKIKQGFGPMLEKFSYVPFNDIESLKREMDEDVAAVMLEVIQGEGGIHIADHAFLKAVEEICHENNSLLVIDEIQTGIGRTGKAFAFQHYGLNPDIVTSAKGLGNGFPIGAVIGTEALKEYFGPGSHGSTFGGNPISIAAAIATMEIIFEEAFLDDVVEKGHYLLEKLKGHLKDQKGIKEIRAKGLMIGIEFEYPIQELLAILRKEGILALPAGECVLRLLPPLNVSYDELDKSIKILHASIKEWNNVKI